MLIPPKPGGAFAESSRRLSPDYSPEPHPFWAESAANSTAEDDLCRKREWRCSPTDVEALRAAAARYERSHNFHNFTVGRDFSDRSSQRFMKSLEVLSSVPSLGSI
jgi:tRNA pseudouridine38-40 synthase